MHSINKPNGVIVGSGRRKCQPDTKADAEGVSVYTETMTPANVGLYEHYGFRVMEQYRVPQTDLSIWSFYRAWE